MSSEIKFKGHNLPDESQNQNRVKLTDLLSRLNNEKKRERNTNIVISIAAISAVTAFGIILSL
tara:strand:- start:29 stop:217 length:189 start_codon:yes stop_codon:yes gene_type:complete